MADAPETQLVFLLDVDNTLLDNDRLKSVLAAGIEQAIGPDRSRRFWELYEDVRREGQVVDYPATVKRWQAEFDDPEAASRLQTILDSIDFRGFVYPEVPETLTYLKQFGPCVILSDGDQVFQRRKIEQSGLRAAVDGNVMISVHKEDELPRVFQAFPAGHYVMVDDKPRILAALEQCCPTEFTTVLVLQGKYGVAGQFVPAPDFTVSSIGDLRHLSGEQLRTGGPAPRRGGTSSA